MEKCSIEIRICIEDCKVLIHFFKFLDFKHVGRSRNNLAHVLAKQELDNNCKILNLGSFLVEIQEIVDRERYGCNSSKSI